MNPANNFGGQPLRYPNIVGKRNVNEQHSDANLPLHSQRQESSYANAVPHHFNTIGNEQH